MEVSVKTSINISFKLRVSRVRARQSQLKTSVRKPVTAVGWDPEGILRPPQGGHIDRRLSGQSLGEAQAIEDAAIREAAKAASSRREQRQAPGKSFELMVEYFLDTEAGDLEYEIARYRNRLDREFFASLNTEIGTIRLKSVRGASDDERLAELEVLRDALQEGAEAFDKMKDDVVSPIEVFKDLLQAADKRARIKELSESQKITPGLVTLIRENAFNAKKVGQEDASKFLEKLANVCEEHCSESKPSENTGSKASA